MALIPRLLRSYASFPSSFAASAGYLGLGAWAVSLVARQQPPSSNQSRLLYFSYLSSLKPSSSSQATSSRETVKSALQLLAQVPLPESVSPRMASFLPCSWQSSSVWAKEL